MTFDYQLKYHRRSQQLSIRIDAQQHVVVTAPRDCPTFFIDRFVHQHQDWISAQLAKVAARQAPATRTETKVQIFGKSYNILIDQERIHSVGVKIVEKTVVVTPVTPTSNSIDRAMTRFLKTTAEKYIVTKTHQLAQKMRTSFRAITLREQKTRWGSCSSQGNLNFNWHLVHYPPEIIDYVIIHELAHRTHMNHSKAFWQHVALYDPEHAKHRGWLRRNGTTVS